MANFPANSTRRTSIHESWFVDKTIGILYDAVNPEPSANTMKVSVIVPVRDEEDSIRELLDGLLNQTRLPDEIVITDGGSLDATPEIIEEYIRKGAPIRLIRATDALPGRGRNLGAADARFEWLGFTDAGIRPANNWLEALVSRAEHEQTVDIVYGDWHPITDTFFKECAAIAYVPPPRMSNGSLVRPRSIVSTLLRREAWEKVKGFPENLRSGEDLLFMDRLDEAGYRTCVEPDAQVFWNLRPTLGSTFRRFLVYSRNNIRAGLWRQWQATILTRYFTLFLLLILILIVNPYWFWLPFAFWVAMMAARAIVSLHRNRNCYPAPFLRNIPRGLTVMSLLAVVDAAAILGCVQWLLLDWFRWSRKAAVEAGNGA